jgi:hypothetical protein
MPKISGNNLDKFHKFVVLFTRILGKLSLHFAISLRFSRGFTRISNLTILLKMYFYAETLRTFQSHTNQSLVHTQVLEKKRNPAIGPLG